MKNISREPLQNDISGLVGVSKVWRFAASDSLGNAIELDGLGWEKRFDYTGRIDGQPVFAGYAKPETPTSQATWLLLKFTYTIINGTGFVTRIQVTTNKWDNILTAFP